jgi:ferritin-like metal-binding protein YciE
MTTEKDLKTQLRALQKLKRETQNFSEERRQINRQIRETREQLSDIEETLKPDNDKQKLIDEITEIYGQQRRPIYTDLRAYDMYQLKVHLEKIKHG